MDGLEYGSPEHRDCVRDVVAMLEQALVVQGAGSAGDKRQARENLSVLLANCQMDGCLFVALSMLATSWQLVGHVRSAARGTSVEEELEQIIATFRERLG